MHLTDATHITDVSRYVSLLLVSLRAMLMLELPQVNVLSKFDLLDDAQQEQLGTERRGTLLTPAFNLEYYTEVQDLSYLGAQLAEEQPRLASFSRALCDLIEDFALVSFETLSVESKESMLHLLEVLDRAVGYVAGSSS